MNDAIRTEVCVESLAGVQIAIDAGADRVELCADLAVDGLTPPTALIEAAVAAAAGTRLAVHVLIRCRAGDFVYSDDEIALMDEQLRHAVAVGADGVVIGALRPDRSVDLAALGRWVATARSVAVTRDPEGSPRNSLAITFHRAFDRVADPLAALAELADAGVDRILTSGQAPTAPRGADLLAQLVSRSATGPGRRGPTILAGGGIGPENVAALIGNTGVTEVHFSGRRNGTIDAEVVRATIAAAGQPRGRRSC